MITEDKTTSYDKHLLSTRNCILLTWAHSQIYTLGQLKGKDNCFATDSYFTLNTIPYNESLLKRAILLLTPAAEVNVHPVQTQTILTQRPITVNLSRKAIIVLKECNLWQIQFVQSATLRMILDFLDKEERGTLKCSEKSDNPC